MTLISNVEAYLSVQLHLQAETFCWDGAGFGDVGEGQAAERGLDWARKNTNLMDRIPHLIVQELIINFMDSWRLVKLKCYLGSKL